MSAGTPNMLSSVFILVLALTTIIAAPASLYDDYIETVPQQRIVPDSIAMMQKAMLQGQDNQAMDHISSRIIGPLRTADPNEVEIVPQKRAALVLDRLLVALQKALREENNKLQYDRPDRDGPRVAPLRIADDDFNDVSSLERRGQTNSGRGRVLRCYFNAITCF